MKKTERSHAIVPAGCLDHVPVCATATDAANRDSTANKMDFRTVVRMRLRRRETEDTREAQHVGKSEYRLNFLQLVSGHDNLIAGHEISGISSFAFVDLRHVYRNGGQHAVCLTPQHEDLALIAGGQHAAGF